MPFKASCFAFTVRPLQGVPEGSPLEKSFRRLFDKYPGFLVAEKSDTERHLHGQLFLPNPRSKSDFNRDFPSKLCEKHSLDWTTQQDRVLREGTKIAYSDDFYLEYTNKDDSVMLVDAFPENSVEYYPSKAEQDSVKRRANAKDAKYHHLLEMWENRELTCVPTYENVAKWVYSIMFVDKTYKVIEDPRRRGQLVSCLTQYLNADISRWEHFMIPEKKKAYESKMDFIAKVQKKIDEQMASY